jgi:hypothetical protein
LDVAHCVDEPADHCYKVVVGTAPQARLHIESFSEEYFVGGISDRKQEIKRRRKRRQKLTLFKRRLKKATVSERSVIADKIRKLTPGGETIIEAWGLQERK